jgi:hypothetical protein
MRSRYEGGRAILMPVGEPVPVALKFCLGMALTHHLSRQLR